MAVETPFLVEPFMKAGTRAFNDKSGALQSDPKNIQNTSWSQGLENNETLDSSQVSAPAYVLAKAARVQQQHGVAPWAVGVDYPKGAISWHTEALHVATSAHTATAANAPGQTNAPWVRSDKGLTDLDTKLQAKIAADILAAKKALFPVGSIYINAKNKTNPGTLLGFGTWARLPGDVFLAQEGSRYQIYEAAKKVYPDGLPNIQGKTSSFNRKNYLSGAFYKRYSDLNDYSNNHGGGHDFGEVVFDASRSNAIYGKANHVQPKTVGACMWRRVA